MYFLCRWYGKEDCKRLCEYAEEWVQCGAKWLGGCCRIYPQDIHDLKGAVKKATQAPM